MFRNSPPRKRGRPRSTCAADAVAAVRAAGRPLTRKAIARRLPRHGAGTIAKALAALVAAGALTNDRDRRGYGLPGWPRGGPGPTLFDFA